MFTLPYYDLENKKDFQEFISICMYAIFEASNNELRELMVLDDEVNDTEIDNFKDNAREIWENAEFIKYDNPF